MAFFYARRASLAALYKKPVIVAVDRQVRERRRSCQKLIALAVCCSGLRIRTRIGVPATTVEKSIKVYVVACSNDSSASTSVSSDLSPGEA